MKYLHSLAHQSFIHLDLKSSNILLSDDFRTTVLDFGPVKLVLDGGKSIMRYFWISKFRIYEILDIRISGYFGFGYWIFRIRIVLNTSNFHSTSLLIAVVPVTPSASMVDYHRHRCTLILTITLIYTFLISIIFSTTDPNVLNQLRKGLDLGNNNFSSHHPKYNPSMKHVLSGNPLFQSNSSKIPLKPSSPSGSQPDNSSQLSPRITPRTGYLGIGGVPAIQLKKKPNVVLSLTPFVAFACLTLLTVPLGLYLCKLKKANSGEPLNSLVIHPLDLFNSDNIVRISIAKDTQMLASVGIGSSESPLGHGGFGVVYKGQLDNGTKIAVKRMKFGVVCNKALDEFESEISVLTKVRHIHLVLLLGYSTQGLKRILVYEYIPQGELSRHLFHWKTSNWNHFLGKRG
ncbi:putative protein kinase RLK-Pelle-LRR-IX family [Helianthus debilis subsp. tardiflorus]